MGEDRPNHFRGLNCPHCDYELRGLQTTRCPECGTKFDPNYVGSSTIDEHRRAPWIRATLIALIVIALAGLIYMLIVAPGSTVLFIVVPIGIAFVVWYGRSLKE